MIFTIVYLLVNVIAFVLFWIDKSRSRKSEWRISERTLMLLTVAGPFGAFAGMNLLRHKTKHSSFVLLVLVSLLAHVYLLFNF